MSNNPENTETLGLEISNVILPQTLLVTASLPDNTEEYYRQWKILLEYVSSKISNPELSKSLIVPKGYGFRGVLRDPEKLDAALQNIRTYGYEQRIYEPERPVWIIPEAPSFAMDYAIDPKEIGIVMVYRGADSMIYNDPTLGPGTRFSSEKKFSHLRTFKSRFIGAFTIKVK